MPMKAFIVHRSSFIHLHAHVRVCTYLSPGMFAKVEISGVLQVLDGNPDDSTKYERPSRMKQLAEIKDRITGTVSSCNAVLQYLVP